MGRATFLVDGETGQASGWNPTVPIGSTQAITAPSTSGALYTGLAIATNSGMTLLYAANFHAGTIDVFNMGFQPTSLGSGAFSDAQLPAVVAPFNVENLSSKLYVT